MEGKNLSQSGIVHFEMDKVDPFSHPHGFAQSHIGITSHYGTPFHRPSVYKVRVGGVSPRCGIEQICAGGSKGQPCQSQSGQYLIEERFVFPTKRSHYGTPFLRPSAYKARVRSVSPRRGIEQIRASGNKGRPYPSQSEQYLIGERFVPSTIII